MEGCLNAGATIDENMETFKIGVFGGATYPNMRFAIRRIYSERVVVFRRRRN
ncbi:hypothetical protein [Peribacillus simplex]|uniref:hypothetical protein n=1 Tax=Peribacillus simplex TaxID=1478 RepID=UPI003D9C55C8